MKEHQRVYKTSRWKKVRQAVFDRDKLICYFCGKLVLEKPNVHHKEELNESNWLDEDIAYNIDNLVTCHHSCHNMHHERFGYKHSIVNMDLTIDYTRRTK